MAKNQPVHKDLLDKVVEVNDVVAFSHSGTMRVGRVIKINPKMIKVKEYTKSKYVREYLKYSFDLVKINEGDAMFYILKNT